MKLIVCPKCDDVLSLRTDRERICECGRSGGRYTDDLNAEIWGEAIPIGIANSSFIAALRARPDAGLGSRFEAFVIPRTCPTVHVKTAA